MQVAMQANNYEVETLEVQEGQKITSKDGEFFSPDGTKIDAGAKDIEVHDGYTMIDGKKYVNGQLVVTDEQTEIESADYFSENDMEMSDILGGIIYADGSYS